MATRIQEQKEERVVSKSRPAMMNMSSFLATSSSSASSPIASKSPGMPIASEKPNSRMSVEPSSFDAASTSQVRHKDAYLAVWGKAGWDPSHQEEDSEDSDNPAAGTWYYKEESVALHTEPVLQFTRKVRRIEMRHGTTISTYRRTHPIMWKPSSPWSGKSMDVNLAILWKIWMWIWIFGECSWIPLFEQQFISEKTMTRIYITRRTISGTLWDNFFWEIKRLISDQSEILGPKTPEIVGLKVIEFEETTWRSISLLCERAFQITTAEVCIFSDSVLCLGEMGGDPNAAWKNKIQWYSDNSYFEELNRNDGMQTEFEWKIFPGFTTLSILEEIQKLMKSTVWTWAFQRQNHLHVNV